MNTTKTFFLEGAQSHDECQQEAENRYPNLAYIEVSWFGNGASVKVFIPIS